MKPTELLQGLCEMKFINLNERIKRCALAHVETAQNFGVSERTFRRRRDREENVAEVIRLPG